MESRKWEEALLDGENPFDTDKELQAVMAGIDCIQPGLVNIVPIP